MESEIKTSETGVLLASVLASLTYCHFISSRLPKGKWRLISLLPVSYLFIILLLYTSSAIFATAIGYLISWLANFKLLLFAFDQGPLIVTKPQKYSVSSLPIFITMAALPFKIIKPNTHKKNFKIKVLPLNLFTEIPIFAALSSILHHYNEYIHPLIQMLGFCILTFLTIDIVVELSNLLVRAVVAGLEVEPASNEPYLSTSLQDFWGNRWDPAFGNILREAVHKPVRSATAAVLGNDWAALPGIMATFLVSGLMHELNTWYVTRASPSWETTMFFVVHGVCVMVQRGLKVAFPEKKWNLPWFVSVPSTVGFVVGTSFWLFWPPLMRS